MEIINREEVMEKLGMFQYISGKIDDFGWMDLDIISADAGTQFTFMELQDERQTRGVYLKLASP